MRIIKRPQERGKSTTEQLRQSVTGIIADVREHGDQALLRYNEQFDQCTRQKLRVGREELEAAYRLVSPGDVADIRQAAKNIRGFALAQKDTLRELPAFSPSPGVVLGHRIIPVRSCCCYVPGGGYPLYSTALMLAIPAKTAGVGRVTACSPVVKGTGHIHPKTLVAMDVAGVDEIYAVGGAHAVAAFSYGTVQIPAVDMIVGPGNSYVTEAKRQCYGQVGIDFVAGPSEVMVIADRTADPELIAVDLLAQSEHDHVAKGIVVTTDESLANNILAELDKLLAVLDTADIARQAWRDYGEIILADSMDEAIDIANEQAPEHLELQVADSDAVLPRLCNYGSLFIGQYTAEVFGDYASGPNHTLPTLRAARYTGGVWVGTFLKTCTHQTLDLNAMRSLAPLTARLAHGEGLSAHAMAAERRLAKWGPL